MDDDLALLELHAEVAYDRMYEAHDPTTAAAGYSDVKEFLADAIGLARRRGYAEVVERLQARIDHIKGVYRAQFP
jgi:hypothetical protein